MPKVISVPSVHLATSPFQAQQIANAPTPSDGFISRMIDVQSALADAHQMMDAIEARIGYATPGDPKQAGGSPPTMEDAITATSVETLHLRARISTLLGKF